MATYTFTRSASTITIQKDALPALTVTGNDFVLDPSDDDTELKITFPAGGRKTYYLSGNTFTVNGSAFGGTTASELATQLRSKVFYPVGTMQVLASNVALSHTGNTTETTVYTGTIPANSIGANGSLDFFLLASATNNANAKTIRFKLNGTTVLLYNAASLSSGAGRARIANRNSLSAQVGMPNSSTAAWGLTGSSAGVSTFSINTGADITLTVTIQNAVAGDTTAVEAFHVVAVN
jgi:hypothetical protein